MGIVRWTAKGLKLTGEILDSDNVEKWILDKGKGLLEKRLKDLPAKWFAGQTRARRWVRKDIEESVASPTFRAALEASLSQLPTILLAVASKISSNAPDLLEADSMRRNFIVSCPRAVVKRLYTDHVVSSLGNSAELAKFSGFPAMFLERPTITAEESYFSDEQRPPELGRRGEVLDTDEKFSWNFTGTNGHYYVGMLGPLALNDLSDKNTSRELRKFRDERLGFLKIKLGRLTPQDIDRLQKQLSSMFNPEPAASAKSA